MHSSKGTSKMVETTLLDKIRSYGTGRRKLDDILFRHDKPPPRLGVYSFDEENLCHEVNKSTCNIPGCTFIAESTLEYESHYNATHRYACSQCKKNLPSPHLLDLHIQETHDSFFSVMALKKPSYCCYIEECKDKFMTPEERLEHGIKEHKLPKDFRFNKKQTNRKKKKPEIVKIEQNTSEMEDSMDLDIGAASKEKMIVFSNSKQKTFSAKYVGKKFTQDKQRSKAINLDVAMKDLKENLPE